MNFGSVCSGIEAASLAFNPLNIKATWFSEIENFPSKVLEHHYLGIPNLGDMNNLPELILKESVEAPDILCGGTPCQAFSLAGWQQGLVDSRGQLTLKFIEVADAIDNVRKKHQKEPSIILWENVEGVLRDKTNAFGIFIAGLSGLTKEINIKRWSNSGVLFGPKRNIAWRILDAKYFGLPQQRRRLFVIATAKNINPEKILFEELIKGHETFLSLEKLYETKNTLDRNLFTQADILENSRIKYISNQKIEIFREYTDCLYSAYGTKWNGNAAAYNGSLYISQNDKIRRLTPIECERLMGFPDNYTLLDNATDTARFKAIGNSWAIPVVQWIAKQIHRHQELNESKTWIEDLYPYEEANLYRLYLFPTNLTKTTKGKYINTSPASNNIKLGNIFDIIHLAAPDKFYISAKASQGILRRKSKRKINMNPSLEELFMRNCTTVS